MDTTNTIIGVVITLCCGIPFFLLYVSKKKKTQQKTKFFKTIAEEKLLTITKIDVFNHLTFGIDTTKKVALITNNSNYEIIDLTACESAFIDIQKKRINKTVEQITDVFLIFKNTNNNTIDFNLFNEDINRLIDGEVEVGQRWINTINQFTKK
ncbi:hypothetical protein [Mesoflavibacter zeaxanthinifaciens]|uniref:hypothetical protein n=1 Tax=Mesoflavibacter zeaxanthinifaciens TaxID=393060 RepID=UPI0026F03AC2|nr:hypothetical protein [Mesoflavibacter zeaxanthinifaciens]